VGGHRRLLRQQFYRALVIRSPESRETRTPPWTFTDLWEQCFPKRESARQLSGGLDVASGKVWDERSKYAFGMVDVRAETDHEQQPGLQYPVLEAGLVA
jgi:hypothetical protein